MQTGVPRWRERSIARSKKKKRVRGVWDAELVRQTLVLEDGRKLTYFLDGPVDHQLEEEPEDIRKLPHIFAFHAMCLSGNVWLMKTPPKDYVLVCVNRPGYYGSDPPLAKTYSYNDFANDVEQLADHLKIDKFYVAGHSSGGPCSLACAAHLKERVAAVGLLSGDPEYAHESAPNKPSKDALVVETVLPKILACVWLPVTQGAVKGLRNDNQLETKLYSFETESITQPVQIYVGANDTVLPPEWSQHLQQRLPNATLRIVPDVGHLDLVQDSVLNEFFPALIALGEVGGSGGSDAAAASTGKLADEDEKVAEVDKPKSVNGGGSVNIPNDNASWNDSDACPAH